ncbi:AMP-binding protein [Pseudoalteromonas shioyasakiensis]|uniref:AMP-binding protein n=1 Tax=Pseudoalteromonas TaxID=53246 RepID=UPI000C8B1652|nr:MULTISPECIES: AMP-binding protein [Pseudoalteromonas]MAD05293.1 AMP-binding protein [Pseudoalteromonas sp.]MCQ8881536.1 AMP-binding protein [Pseudoalteromonas shioyasakiensis]URQ91899.1 AMP-binding protein [Pseudoalteromonas sp. SCSIO 43101]|tara:strand:+ start:3712 stop:5427 length:1716 start_codon:yes stop_codon:yes gene_type:complete
MQTKNTQSNALPLSHSYYKGCTDSPLIDKTIGQYLDDIVDNYPEHPAIVVHHQQIRLTYKQYQHQINQLAMGLLAIGVKPGDRVGIWSPNNIEWCLTQFATAKIGAIMVCINPAYRPNELKYALNSVECSTLITASEFKASNYISMLNELAPELSNSEPGELNLSALPHLKNIIRIGNEPAPGMFSFNDIMQRATDAHKLELDAIAATLHCDQDINIQFTSGTTGNPKGATLSHKNILNNGFLMAQAMKLTHMDKLCIPVPLYHCFGMVLGNLVCISKGATAVFPGDSFDPKTTLEVVEKERCTGLHGVPTMFIAELELKEFANYDLSSLRTGVMAGSTCPEQVMRKVHTLMHMTEVVIGYGQTECSPINNVTETDSPLEKQVTTVGRALAHTEVKIIDELGDVQKVGIPGEVCSRGAGIMRCYWNDEEKTNATIDKEGWLHSGDLGVMDKDGFVAIVGRIKDMIIRGGENIYPREIEEVLYTYPGIQDAAIFGISDEKYGEEVCAWIQPKDDAVLDENAIREFLKDKLAYFKVPKYIRFVEEYPMTVTGKLQKFKMREQMQELLSEKAFS